MRIVVCVKYVPDMQSERTLDDDGHLVRGLDDALNELDENSVEAAIALAEHARGAGVEAEVLALTVGPDDAIDAVRRSLQMGADAGVHLSDPAVAGADVLGTARVLAGAIAALEAGSQGLQPAPVDLVVTGMATMDGLTSMLPTALAAVLDRPALTFASHLELEFTDGAQVLSITRSLGETEERQRAVLPALVSVTDQANEPRMPGAMALMSARKKPVTTLTLADLPGDALTSEALATTAVVSAEPRPPRETGRILTDTGDAGRKLADYLIGKGLA
ncbi:electron transfer flavoprotein subunit beta/FixA family protein [Bogoriella caseilytica]|uniref:Electron transfer flavoprotein beta subunit n=1 Tax=Bogoriella caseilytica TaxID=56055 RepID=A0A3N2B9Y1_9MICO|nr:electron transfer flavoprotein subunit beta/FixA family protein [Bogoriella caseilytica]ROR72065.1 electron transfer flavoprotein beta subunit [Bogoriella caseilytica]